DVVDRVAVWDAAGEGGTVDLRLRRRGEVVGRFDLEGGAVGRPGGRGHAAVRVAGAEGEHRRLAAGLQLFTAGLQTARPACGLCEEFADGLEPTHCGLLCSESQKGKATSRPGGATPGGCRGGLSVRVNKRAGPTGQTRRKNGRQPKSLPACLASAAPAGSGTGIQPGVFGRQELSGCRPFFAYSSRKPSEPPGSRG